MIKFPQNKLISGKKPLSVNENLGDRSWIRRRSSGDEGNNNKRVKAAC